MQRNKQVITS